MRFTAEDFLAAETVVNDLIKNREIHFQLHGPQMSRDEAVKHFKEREALVWTKKLLLDEAERILPK